MPAAEPRASHWTAPEKIAHKTGFSRLARVRARFHGLCGLITGPYHSANLVCTAQTACERERPHRLHQDAPLDHLRRRNELPPDLATLSVRELKALARERRLNIDYPMEKSELVAKIEATFR